MPDVLEEKIAQGMAVGIINSFETVYISKNDAKAIFMSPSCFIDAAKFPINIPPIIQTSKRIGESV